MPKLYVGGPVIRPSMKILRQRRLETAYTAIGLGVRRRGWQAVLPYPLPYLEHVEGEDFAKLILALIEDADRVITVFTEGDSSVGAEAAAASFLQKPQLVVELDRGAVPRFVKGLPGVTAIVRGDAGDLITGKVSAFLPQR